MQPWTTAGLLTPSQTNGWLGILTSAVQQKLARFLFSLFSPLPAIQRPLLDYWPSFSLESHLFSRRKQSLPFECFVVQNSSQILSKKCAVYDLLFIEHLSDLTLHSNPNHKCTRESLLQTWYSEALWSLLLSAIWCSNYGCVRKVINYCCNCQGLWLF